MAPGDVEQRPARRRIVAVVLQRLGDRFGHDRVGREVHDGVDLVPGEQRLEQAFVAAIADDQLSGRDRRFEARGEVVERDDRLAALAELPDDVAADVSGAAGHKYLFVSHRLSGLAGG